MRSELKPRTTLSIGDVGHTVDRFFEKCGPPAIGFISFDMDLYSATRNAFRIFTHPYKHILVHKPLYF